MGLTKDVELWRRVCAWSISVYTIARTIWGLVRLLVPPSTVRSLTELLAFQMLRSLLHALLPRSYVDVNGFRRVEGRSKVDGRVLVVCQAVNSTSWSETKGAHGFKRSTILHGVFAKREILAQDNMFDVS